MSTAARSGRVLTAVRVAYGAALLLVPRPALGALTRPRCGRREPDGAEVVVARVLGLRQLAQAAGERALPRGRTLGALVDTVHALSMLGWAAVDRGHRPTALTSAVIALAFATTAGLHLDEGAGSPGSRLGGHLRCTRSVVQ